VSKLFDDVQPKEGILTSQGEGKKMLNKNIKCLRFNLLMSVIVLGIIVCVGIGCKKERSISSTASPWLGDPIVQTVYGKVKAPIDDLNTWVWKAIPYAKPPLGELRWKAPQDPSPWDGLREEVEFSAVCPQYNNPKDIVGSEDCLYLNIWRPKSEEEDLPVYFWIHGGGNSFGSANPYNGENLALKANMIVVTMNYRLGPFGWFTHPALKSGKRGDEYDDSGNYGILDLIKALEWIKLNIQAFGGDPDNVTIAGESAGARDVITLLISPAATGLFHRAISQSGRQRMNSAEAGEANAVDKIERLLINDGTAENREAAKASMENMSNSEIADYLRSKTPVEILACYDDAGITGMLGRSFIDSFKDGAVIPESGYKTLSSGTYPNKVPIILGSNKYEEKLFLSSDPFFEGKDELYQIVASHLSDLWKVSGVDDIARKLRSFAYQPDVYVYQFLWGAGGDVGKSVIPEPWGFKLGASHGLEIPFIFGGEDFLGGFGPQFTFLDRIIFNDKNRPGREALTDAMIEYVAQFIRIGNPNKPGSVLPKWLPWSNEANVLKCILFDADYERADIKMSSEELTLEGVMDRANEIEEPTLSEVKAYLENRH
jgi:para-nitrobenzyl esterase